MRSLATAVVYFILKNLAQTTLAILGTFVFVVQAIAKHGLKKTREVN